MERYAPTPNGKQTAQLILILRCDIPVVCRLQCRNKYDIDIDFVKITLLLPNILINPFPKFIYSYAAASPHLTVDNTILNSVTLTRNLRIP